MSGTIDAAIPLQAKAPAQPNPLQQIGDFANAKNALNSLQLFPGQQQLQQQAIQGGQANLTQLHRQLGAASLVPLLAKPGPISISDVTGALGGAERGGVVTQPMVQSISALPLTGDPAADDRTLRSFILANSQAPANAAAAVTPGQVNIDQGPVIQPFLRGASGMPNQGQMTPVGTPIKKATGPETLAAESPVWIQQPDGTWVQKPQARSERPGASGAPQADIPGNGAYVPRGAGASTPPALSTPPLGVAEDVASYKRDQQAVPNIQTGLVSLQTAKEALALTQSGRSSEAVHNFYSFLKTQGISPPFIDGDITNYDIARKALLSYAASQGSAAGTDLGLDTALHSNASMDIDTSAANHVINQNIGLQRMKLAQVMEAPTGGNGYGSHVTNFANENDPRAFAWDAYSPSERQQIIADVSKSKGGLDKLDHSLEIAAKRGLIHIPTAQAPQQNAMTPANIPGQ